jgi:Sulfotransferase domain
MNASVEIPNAAGLTLPDFLGIGAQKAGTSWLHENLKPHPGVFVPEEKELHFFDQHFEQGLESYSRKFESAGARVKGEITPAYGILRSHQIGLIRHLMPRLKIIFLMRNPIDRAWSQALMNLAVQPGRPVASLTDQEIISHFQSDRSRMRGDYESILKNWLSHFDRRQVFTAFFEDISTRPKELLSDVFQFLGLSTDLNWSAFPYNQVVLQGAGATMPPRLRRILVEIYQEPIRRLGQLFNAPAQRWLTSE